MKVDKNTVIGLVLLFALFLLYFWYNNTQQTQYLEEKKRIEDSTAKANIAKQPKIDTATARIDSVRLDSAQKVAAAGGLAGAATGTEELTLIENDLMKVSFTNKGGTIKQVTLKQYRSWDSTEVILGGDDHRLGYTINTDNRSAQTTSLFFTPSAVSPNSDGSKTITYSVSAPDGRIIKHIYTIRPGDYMIDWNVELMGADRLLSQGTMNLEWALTMKQHQKDIKYERQQTNLCYMEDGSYDFTRAAPDGVDESLEKVDWVSYKQQFFNTTIVPKLKFENAKSVLQKREDSTHVLYSATSNMQVKVPVTANSSAAFQLYYGPNDYRILKSYENGMMNIVDLGSGVFAFVKYINRWVIMPVFNFFASFIANYGWVIALLTLFIRLITSPLTYKSYLSGAKMKVLRPELDELKKKHGGDQQAFAMDQMKLFREAGVSPLGGCIPALLQIPIFFSLYAFFNANLALRGEDFLWAKDLSQYDVIARLPFEIPFYGDHVSLFTLTAVITSFLISIYNISMTPTQDNPVLKYMPYIFPVILLFIFNSLPAALTWYYTVSNIVTLAMQFVIQKYIIDHDKILAQIDEKRKAPKKKSKWAERYEQMMEQQKKMQDTKQKGSSKR